MIKRIIFYIQDFFSGDITFKKFLPGIAWFFILLVLLCLPARDLPKSNDWLEKIFFDKWVHMGLFGVLAFLFMAPVFTTTLSPLNKWLCIIVIATLVSAWGLTTEFIQHYLISGRSFDKFDWVADTVGALLAIFITTYILKTKPASSN